MESKDARIEISSEMFQDVKDAIVEMEKKRYANPAKESFLLKSMAENISQSKLTSESMTKNTGQHVEPSVSGKWFSWLETQVTARQASIDSAMEELLA